MSQQYIKALQTILKQQADNCVALTYSLDLPFFEYMLFEPLYNAGCRNVTVLCDPGQYEAALDEIPALKHLGQRYLCLPCTITKAAFHPKLILLTSNEAGLLLVGSGNVSRSGLTHNQEVWTRLAYTNNAPDEFGRAAFRWAFNYLSKVSEAQHDPMLQQRLDQLWKTTGWLRQDPVPTEDDGRWLLHNLDRPILDQLVDRWTDYDGSPVREAVILSPYFDRKSLAFDALLERLHPQSISLITEPGAPGLDPEAVHGLLNAAGVPLSSQRLELDSRRLHAKSLALRTERGSWILTGSPNFSRPAMLRSVRHGNAELAMLRYEPDPAYVDLIMAPISEKAVPMELDWPPSPEETVEAPDDEQRTYRLVRAEVADRRLAILVKPGVPEHARLRVELSGQEARFFEVDRWEREGDTIVLELPENVRHLLSAPVSVKLTIESSGAWESSTRTIVNNSVALRASSRPVWRQERASVPERLVSEDFEQDIQLLSRLQNLLAMNPQQLRDHRGISRQTAEELRREDVMAVSDEDYDPETMIVDERLRRIEVRTGGDLYVDFYERAFYEDVLAAARAAVYRPWPETAPDQGASYEDRSTPDYPQPSEPARASVTDPSAIEKVARGFARLVKNFERGMQDSEYLAQVSPTYLQELFFILTTFLRSLWRQNRVNDEKFFDLSERLFAAFLGDERESTGWPVISRETTKEQPMRDEAQSHFQEQVWLHLYLLADYAFIEDEELLPALARLLRLAARELSTPTILANLPNDTLAAMWRNSFSRDLAVPNIQAVVGDLIEYSQWYSEETLRQELKRSLGVRVNIERRGGWSLPAVPIMEVDGTWSDDHLDTYWRAFTTFCRWPKWKKNARLEVYDSNPTLARADAKRLILFYRSAPRRLSVLVNPDNKALACMKQSNEVSLQEVCELQNFSDAILV